MDTINKREDGAPQKKYRITEVIFDTDGNKALAKSLAKKYVGKFFLATDWDDADSRAADIVSDASGWCILNINFEKV